MQKRTTTTLEFDDYIITYDRDPPRSKLQSLIRLLGSTGLELLAPMLAPNNSLADFEIKSIKSKEKLTIII